jgi:hypothetical protein
MYSNSVIDPLNAKLSPICHLVELLGVLHILHFSRIKVNIEDAIGSKWKRHVF